LFLAKYILNDQVMEDVMGMSCSRNEKREKDNAQRVLAGKSGGKTPLETPNHM
jgi:hypothetical protein